MNKDLLTTQTFWGAVIGAVSTIAAIFGHSINVSQQTELITGLTGLAGFMLSMYGRTTANLQITSVAGIPTAPKTAPATMANSTPIDAHIATVTATANTAVNTVTKAAIDDAVASAVDSITNAIAALKKT